MDKKTFVSIGHIVNDSLPKDHLGGSVAYSAITAKNLGFNSQIVTKCDPTHPYIQELENREIKVHLLPTAKAGITTFKNTYDKFGKRTQVVTSQQEQITKEDLKLLPIEIFQDAIILISPVIGEISLDVIPLLKKYGLLSITPQGYFRSIDNQTGQVSHKRWENFQEALKDVHCVIFSSEDITISGKVDFELLEEIKNASNLTILTQGEKGATVFEQNKPAIHVDAFHLEDSELKDFTGAGDTFATAFRLEYALSQDLKEAAKKACLFAAIKITAIGGIGIDSIPTQEQVKEFLNSRNAKI